MGDQHLGHAEPHKAGASGFAISQPSVSTEAPTQESTASMLRQAWLNPSALSPSAVLALQRTVGNAAVNQLLQRQTFTSHATNPLHRPNLLPSAPSPRTLPANRGNGVVQRVDTKTVETLILDDQREDRAAQEQGGYLALRNWLTATFGGRATPCLQMFEDKWSWPIDFAGLLQACRQKAKIQNQYDPEQAATIIRPVVDAAGERVRMLFESLQQVGATANKRELLEQYGYEELQQIVSDFRQRQETQGKSEQSVSFEEFARDHSLKRSPRVDLTKLAPTNAPAYESVGPTDTAFAPVHASAERTRKSKPPMDPNDYIHRHLSPSLMEFLLTNADVPIIVLEGTTNDLLALAQQGYTDLYRLSDNPQTDFVKYTAHNTKTGQTCLFILAASGLSYRREVLAHFTHYQDPKGQGRVIDLNRIKLLYRHPEQAEEEFATAIEGLDLMNINILVLGKVDDFSAQLKQQYKINPARIIRSTTPPLFGVLYLINGKRILSLQIEPGLYAGRAGAFLRVLCAASPDLQAVLFAGTAGALDRRMGVNDIVAPGVFSQVDALQPEGIHKIKNLAIPLLSKKASEQQEEADTSRGRVFAAPEIAHGAVDSILLEDADWLMVHRKTITVVEQEVASLLQAASKYLDKIRFYIFFTISDVVGEASFAQAETHQTKPAKFKQGDLLVDALGQELGDEPKSGGPRAAVTVGNLQQRIPGNNLKGLKNEIESSIKDLKKGKEKVERVLPGRQAQLDKMKQAAANSERSKEEKPEGESEASKKAKVVQEEITQLTQEKEELGQLLEHLSPFPAMIDELLRLRVEIDEELQPLLAMAHALNPKQARVLQAQIYDTLISAILGSSKQKITSAQLKLQVINAVGKLLQSYGALVSSLLEPSASMPTGSPVISVVTKESGF